MYDCYEIHLRYGRKKKTAANTIARCAMARRRRLIEEGHIAADDMGVLISSYLHFSKILSMIFRF